MTPSLTPEPAVDQKPPARDLSFAFRWVFPALGVCSLLAACVILSLKKQEWADEVFTRTELSDPSLLHLMHALTRLGGAGMPLFYLTAWPWAHVFGFSDLSLRLYSSAGVCGALLVLTAAMRRRFSARAAFLGIAFGMFACMILVDQNAEARGYGLYLLLCTLAIAQLLRVADTPRPGACDLALLALSQAGLVLGHVLGLSFSGLLLLALAGADLRQRRLRWKVYACYAAGWLALLPWIPAIRASAAVAKPHGWIVVPSIGDLVISCSYWLFAGIYFPLMRGTLFGVVAGWSCAIFCVGSLLVAASYGLREATPNLRVVYFAGFALMSGPLAFFIVSHVATPIWVARYMIPAALGVGMLAVCWAERTEFVRGVAGIILSVVVLLLPIAAAAVAHPDSLDVVRVDQIAAGRTVVSDWAPDFMVMLRYSADPAKLEFPLDWPAALVGPPAAVGAFHLMDNYRRDGYMTANLIDVDQVLAQKSFLVLDTTDTNWFQVAIAKNPRFAWRVLAQTDKKRRVIEVDQQP
jgi:hypothetical protein